MIFIPSPQKEAKLSPIKELTPPSMLYIPLYGYKTTLQPLVKIGDSVKKYQPIAQSEGFFRTVVHAPVSGTIVGDIFIENQSYLVIENDFKEESITVKPFDVDHLSKEEIIDILATYGIEGSGGARFPTHLKYRIGANKVDTFIINGAECEPYLNADFALMRYKTESILKAIRLVQQLLNAKEIVIAIEKHNKELKKVFESYFSAFQLPIRVQLLPDEYPQGGELQLIRSVTGKELLKGSIPIQSGVVVNNVGTLWAVYNVFYEGKPYVERIVTISGELSAHSGNYIVKVGTPVSHILDKIGWSWNLDKYEIILGGPMMGRAVHQPETPIGKGNGGLLILSKTKTKQYNCIQCGYCTDVCPQHLMPMEFVRSVVRNDTERLIDHHLNDCIECGTCEYACPSDVPLMHNIFSGKAMLISQSKSR